MKIRLDRVYTGFDLVNVPKGVYDINDAILKGRGQYLVDNRIAFPIKGPEIVGLDDGIDDDEEGDEEEVVTLLYVGTNKKAHDVEADGEKVHVPAHRKGKDGNPAPRRVTVSANVAEELLATKTFKLAGS